MSLQGTDRLPGLPAGLHWRESEGLRWIEGRAGRAGAAFSTRLGGASETPFDSLNLGLLTGDDAERVRANRVRLAAALGLDPAAVAIGRQVHGSELLVHGDRLDHSLAGGGEQPPEADGHVFGSPGAALVLVADCLPIVLAGERGAAVVHGGWRGLAGGIVERAARQVAASQMLIGPGIGACCYEVGDEVAQHFSGLGEGIIEDRNLDLAAAAAELGRRCGVERTVIAGVCTRCNPHLFFSHRGQGPRTGRQAGVGWLAPDA